MTFPRALKLATVSFVTGLASLGFITSDAHSVTNNVKNISDGYYIEVDDSCTNPRVVGPGQTVNLKCSGRRFYVPRTDCVRLKRVGFVAHKYCAGSRGTWQSFAWAPGTTTLKRTT